MRIPALVAAAALALVACQTASADFISYSAGASSGFATDAELDSQNIFTQTFNIESSVFGTPNSSTATFSYSGMDGLGPGTATFNWTLTNTGAETYHDIVFDLLDFVGIPATAVAFDMAGAGGFMVSTLSASQVAFSGALNPGESAVFSLVADLADLASDVEGSFGLRVTTSVPEPSSLVLVGIGTMLAGGGIMRRRQKTKKAEA